MRPIIGDGEIATYLGSRVRIRGARTDLVPLNFSDGFPPTPDQMQGSVPLDGFEVKDIGPQGESLEVLFGFTLNSPGRFFTRRGAELTYVFLDGKELVEFLPSYVAVCAPRVPVGSCQAEDESGPVG